MERIEVKGKPRGRNGGRKFGSKDKGPRPSKGLTEVLFLRLAPELLHRITRDADQEGVTVSDFIRAVLEREVV